MARSFKGTVKFSFDGILTNDSSTASDQHIINATNSFSNGTGANQAQRMWYDEGRALTASQAEDLDMFDLAAFDIGGGAGLDSLGQAHAITGVKMIYVKNLATSAGSLVVGNKNATTAWNAPFNASDTGAITLAPGAWFCITDPTALGFDVTDTDNHLLTFTDAGSTCSYDVAFIGI